MKSRFGLKLTFLMIIFALSLSLTIATTGYFKLKEEAIEKHQELISKHTELAEYALNAADKVFSIFGDSIALQMEEYTITLLDLYDQNPNFSSWDFDQLKQSMPFDIYIINRNNVITYSTYSADIGLDFNQCCVGLAKVLDERRAVGNFFHDGIDLEQASGKIKSYSYMATRDHQNLIQLGYDLNNDHFFKEFDFLRFISNNASKYPDIIEMNVLNRGGAKLGVAITEGKLEGQREQHFKEALRSNSTIQFAGEWKGEKANFRYVPYRSPYDQSINQHRVLEVIYNDDRLNEQLNDHVRTYILQLLLIVACTVIMALIIVKWISRPMYLAFHDSLTGLLNRAALEEELYRAVKRSKDLGDTDPVALLMIDLDNFKQVNDRFGHEQGDQVLKTVAHCLQTVVHKRGVVIRRSGDEFVVIAKSMSRQQAEQLARTIVEQVRKTTSEQHQLEEGLEITISMGISMYPMDGTDPDELSAKADQALYVAKEKGKSQYQFYDQ